MCVQNKLIIEAPARPRSFSGHEREIWWKDLATACKAIENNKHVNTANSQIDIPFFTIWIELNVCSAQKIFLENEKLSSKFLCLSLVYKESEVKP